jgi:flagellin
MTQTTGVEFPSAVVNNAGEAFWSSAYNLTGQNASLNSQIFKYSFANNSVTQATSNTASGFTIYSLSLSQDGSYLSVVSAKSVFGIGSTAGQSVVRMNTSTFQTETISSLGAGDGYPGLASIYVSADGNSVFGVGNSVTGNNDVLNFRTARNSLNTAIETGSGSSGIINTQIGAINGTLRGLGTLGLSTQYAARGTLETIQDNIQRLSLMQSSIGAGLARLSSADQLLRESVLQFQQAKSRITDIDVAVESANLIREQIRQQSATALLAQAKLQPALILNLLNFN